MKRAIVIQHVAMEGPARIADVFQEAGVTVDVREVYAGVPVPTVIAPDELLVVMGGGMGVADRRDPRFPFLDAEITLLATALAAGRGVLGICLGAQLLAHAAGARVFPNLRRDDSGREVAVREVGWAPVSYLGGDQEPALAGLGAEELVLHWHGDTFDLPAGAVHLASTPRCRHQAFRLGPRAFGVQFHVEVDAATACRWAVEDADFVRAARGPDGPALVIAETERYAAAAQPAGERLIRNILGCLLDERLEADRR